MKDPRELVYVKKNGRYVPVGNLNDGWYKFDGFRADGLWLHKSGPEGSCGWLISTLDDLPCAATLFAAVAQHRQELIRVLDNLPQGRSLADTADEILKWIATKGTKQ